jgi:hypothetical protein
MRPLIAEVVREVFAQVDRDRTAVTEQFCYTEAEAAALLRLHPHQLRDERLRKRIAASAIVGRRIRYLRGDLLRYLTERRVQEN